MTVVPGIHIDKGELIVDERRLTYPGDLLHEAGHLAVRAKDQWESIDGDVGGDGGDEMAAMAWSYAAAVHLGIDPAVVFHPGGYKDGSEAIINAFVNRDGMGVPVLQYLGMTVEKKSAAKLGVPPYPAMRRWIRTQR